jgi:hypothetical protein
MASLKTLTIAAALIAGATSPVLAQSGPPTGGQPPVAGGAAASGQTGATGAAAKVTHKKTAKHPKKSKQSRCDRVFARSPPGAPLYQPVTNGHDRA